MKYMNIATYKFIKLSPGFLHALQKQLKEEATEHHLKGTILLSTEGINIFMAGEPDNIKAFTDGVIDRPEFADLWFKESLSSTIPFKRLRVRIKEEIIAMKTLDIDPVKETAPYVEPAELKQWYEDNKEMVILDTRNNYEFKFGTFDDAVQLDIENFRDFPEAIKQLPDSVKKKPIVTFCTGGIRCEKAAALLMDEGFENVFQLKGGILNYFEQCGGEHYEGDCFVFDDRVAVDNQLKPFLGA